MPVTKWESAVGKTRIMRLRDTAVVAEFVLALDQNRLSADLNIYDVTGQPDPDPASMGNTVLRETRPVEAGQALVAWLGAKRDDTVLWRVLQGAVAAFATRGQTADQAAQAAIAAVVPIVPDVDTAVLGAAVRRIALSALTITGSG